jgi:pyruvate/2-oxoglutarate dehydrogenase complex dihydrolipoamide acyltransferase (E2) component
MPAEITMPKLGLTMTTGTIVRWLKAPGDTIVVGEPLLEVSTDKISYEVESPVGGTLERAIGAEGDEFAPGAVIGLVTDEHEIASVQAHASPVSALELSSGHQPERTAASPAARRLARERGIEIGAVAGSGPGGRVTLDDVEAAKPAGSANGIASETHAPAASAPPAAAPAGVADMPAHLPPARRAIFRRMSEIAQLPLAQVETTARVDALHTLIQRRGDVGWTAFVVFAAARLLVDYPVIRTDARTGAPHPQCDVGVAADTRHGLIVPVVRDAAKRSLREIQDEIARLAGAAREGRLAPADVGEAAFTVSNVGPQGIDRVVPLVDPPQTAILGVGAAGRRPAVVSHPVSGDDLVAPAWMMTLVLSFDHRFIDGAPAARFLAALSAALTDPGILL